MSLRVHLAFLTLVVIALAGIVPVPAAAQDEERPMTIQFSQDFDRFFYLDEIGIQMALTRQYESHIDIETYRLDSGDLLGLSLEGNVTGAYRGLRVNSQGMVLLPQAGMVMVRGLLFDEASDRIEEKIQNVLPDTRIKLFLEQPRTIKIHVVGNVPFAGPHLVQAQTRVDQAIYYSFFQPTNSEEEEEQPIRMLVNKYPDDFIGSNQFAIRSISITRTDGTVDTADLIRYLKTGAEEANPVVTEGDIIHINRFHTYNPRVSISGAVHQALEMEYRPDDSINRLLRMAGGNTYDAADHHLRVLRQADQGLQEIILDDSTSIAQYEVQPNDRIIIPFDREKRATYNAQVYGEVRLTGRFPIKDGETTLFELLELTGGFTDQAMPHAAYLLRTQPGRTEYGTRDAFNPLSLRRTSDQYEQGFEYLNLEAQLIRNRVYVDLTDEDQLKSVKLFDGDRLHIPKDDGTIFVFGQVNQPGYYNFEDGISADGYIKNAGGLALSADADRIFIVKAQTDAWYRPGDVRIEPGDLVFVDRVPFDELQAARAYDIQKRTQRNSNIQLVMTGLTTITSIITAYIAVTR